VIPFDNVPSIFLSHSSADKPFARRLAGDLRARGVRVWLDEAEIGIGDSLIGTSAERGVTWATCTMIALHGSFDDERKARFRAVVESHVKDSDRLRAVAAYLDSRISEDALEAALDR
jgi:hypothetical protein